MKNLLHEVENLISHQLPYTIVGKVIASKGNIYETFLPQATIGSNVLFECDNGESCLGEVVSIKEKICFCIPYLDLVGVNRQTKIYLQTNQSKINLTSDMLGKVLDYSGQSFNSSEILNQVDEIRSIYGQPLNPLDRVPIAEPLQLGVRSIDSFLTIGKGQRIAIMAGSGVGKSVLMGMIAKNTNADVNVIALIGERGREVLDFIQTELGEEGLKKSVVVVATSDSSPLLRVRAAYTATTIAEFFRDQGKDVMLMMDSVTRFAMASREISLSIGESPGPKGYAPSVFSKLPKLLERAGTKQGKGSITGIYTVLVEGGDFDEPIADAIRSISDGHIVLSRKLAEKGFYPAIDVLGSISRVMNKVVKREHLIIAHHLRDLMGVYKQSEDLINIGAYVKGVNPKLDKAVIIKDDLENYLKQDVSEYSDLETNFDAMVEIAKKAERAINPEIFKDQYGNIENSNGENKSAEISNSRNSNAMNLNTENSNKGSKIGSGFLSSNGQVKF